TATLAVDASQPVLHALDAVALGKTPGRHAAAQRAQLPDDLGARPRVVASAFDGAVALGHQLAAQLGDAPPVREVWAVPDEFVERYDEHLCVACSRQAQAGLAQYRILAGEFQLSELTSEQRDQGTQTLQR